VELDYAVGDFNEDLRGQLKQVIAHVAGVEEQDFRVTLASVADAQGSTEVDVHVQVPAFEVVPVADRAGIIRDALTRERINNQVALTPDGLRAITAVINDARVQAAPRSFE